MSDNPRPRENQAAGGDPIPEVFPPNDSTARFVVSMSMANNDIDRAMRDLLRAHDEDTPDFTYRVRLSVGYLVEAIDALDAYCRVFDEVRTLLARIPTAAQDDLKVVRGTLQKAGPKTLQRIRDNTFHYPSPDRKYKPTSDDLLREALAGMGGSRTMRRSVCHSAPRPTTTCGSASRSPAMVHSPSCDGLPI